MCLYKTKNYHDFLLWFLLFACYSSLRPLKRHVILNVVIILRTKNSHRQYNPLLVQSYQCSARQRAERLLYDPLHNVRQIFDVIFKNELVTLGNICSFKKISGCFHRTSSLRVGFKSLSTRVLNLSLFFLSQCVVVD